MFIKHKFSYFSNPDETLTILDPERSHFCTCPMMSNNTWTLPVHLLPPVTVNKDQHYSPAGTLVTTGKQLLPFRLPLNPAHFNREMVLRATQTRQLHEFLCHPSDRALKSTLNQGTFAQYSHLTPSDVDLMARTTLILHRMHHGQDALPQPQCF